MTQCRMISKVVFQDNKFTALPYTAQTLYVHLMLNADDEGFVSGAKRVARYVGLTKKILNILSEHDYILYFEESDTALIKHWYKHNRIKRPAPTLCVDEKSQVYIVDNCYILSTEAVDNS